MTATPAQGQPENVLTGALFALLVLPVGVVVIVLLSSINFVASIAGYLIAFLAVLLYRRGSGGVISRVGAWTITAIVLATVLIGIWATLFVVSFGGLGHLGDIGNPQAMTLFNENLPALVNGNLLFIGLIVLFAAVGSFRILGRAFRTAHQTANPANLTGQSTTLPAAPQTYHDDIDANPTGSADDKTAPPTTGS
ncbi:MAG TPA: hypothetical protein VIJ11_06035 [Galbitalea sp.]